MADDGAWLAIPGEPRQYELAAEQGGLLEILAHRPEEIASE
jgi:hypothetical protein